jgi:uncharacterized membrane protein YqaE (UPF0057 family)
MKQIEINIGRSKKIVHLNFNTYNDLEKELKKNYNLSPDEYFITSRHQLINKDYDFFNSNTNYYILHPRIKGGMSIGDFFDSIMGVLEKLYEVLLIFAKIPDFFVWLFVDVLKWLITDFLNPIYILSDLGRGIIAVLRVITLGFLDIISGLVRSLINLVFDPIVSNFWGYTPKKNERNPNDKTESNNCADSKRCFKQPSSRVPFPILISTVILPPMGLFMELGLKGWMNLLICSILTLFYYFPGLIYALIILYC